MFFTPRATRGSFSVDAASRGAARVPRVSVSRQDYPEGEFSRSGDEVRGGRERAVAAAAAAAGVAAGVEPHPAAAVGPGLPAGALPGRFPLRVPRVSDHLCDDNKLE